MEFLEILWLGKPGWMWLTFIAIVLTLLVLDLGVFHREEREIGVRESLAMSAFYITLGLAFGGWIWWQMGPTAGMNYVTGFVVEKSLAMDNVFVIAMIFAYFGIPRLYQHRVLFWGILGAMFFRAILIGTGSAVLHEFEWLLLFFSAILIFTGVKLLLHDEEETLDIANNRLFRFLARHIPMTHRMHGAKFLVREEQPGTGRMALVATPLLFALIVVEISDLIFAVDSIPAVLAISRDPFIVYTSNVFAILNLRALYFVIDALVARCCYLKPALSAVLIFIGGKILWDAFIGETEALVSLAVTVTLIGGAIALSFMFPKPAASSETLGAEMIENTARPKAEPVPLAGDPNKLR